MGVVGRLDQYASMLAAEFDDYSMSENLIKRSEDLTIAVGFWTEVGDGVTVTTNQVTAPDGTQTADKVAIKSTNLNFKSIQSSILGASVIGQAYTASIFCKAAEHSYIRVDMEGGGNSGGIAVNLTNGSLISQLSAPDSYSIQAYPNGWYRIAATSTATTTAASALRVYLTGASGVAAFSGTIGNGVYLWGGQYESSSSVTDYTPTTTTAKTRVLASTTNTNITGLGTYYSSGFDENVGFTTFLPANISAPYDLVYDEFGGTFFGAGQGRYMRQYTDKSVIVYNEIDEITNFTDTDISFWTSNPQTYNQSNGPFGSGQETSSIFTSATLTATGSGTDIPIDFDFNSTSLSPSYIKIYKNSSLIFTYLNNTTDSSYNVSYNAGDTFYFQVQLTAEAGDFAILVLRNYGSPIFTFSWFPILD